jgi:hypothetical protein
MLKRFMNSEIHGDYLSDMNSLDESTARTLTYVADDSLL